MADGSKEKRRKIMASIKSKNTKPEVYFRKQLFKYGFRYGLHNKNLVGKPDLSLPKYNCVIFVNGCFWHHHSCKDGHYPKSNKEFWRNKINRNVERDNKTMRHYKEKGIRVIVIWECTISQMRKDPLYNSNIIETVSDFLQNKTESQFLEI